MKKKRIKAGVAVAIGTAIVAGSVNAQTPNIEQEAITKRGVTDSIKLENRLKELAALPPREQRMIAMCYSTTFTMGPVEYVCPHCKKKTNSVRNITEINNLHQVERHFEQIKAEGYDVILDRTEFCNKCSKGKKSIEYPVPVFKIRFSENSKYYEVKTGFVSDYLCLIAFLRDERLYKGKNIEEYLPEQIQIIQKMTGLGKDLKIKR